MRICSFLPSATEMLYALGLGDSIVGVTHECDYPPEALTKPKVVRSSFDASCMSSEEIDAKIRELVLNGKDIYVVDDQLMKRLSPDVIVAQGICEVCSPYLNEIARARRALGYQPKLIMLDPHDLDGVLESIVQLARELGVEERGVTLVNSLRARIDAISARAMTADSSPRVLCIEWLKPFFSAGHWVPQMVELVNAVNCVSRRGEPSRRMEWDEVLDADPDIIVFMPCGFDVDKALREFYKVEENKEWFSLRAVKNRQVYVVDANAYFSRPSPRIVRGLEILARIIHPELFRDIEVREDEHRNVYLTKTPYAMVNDE
ncbi:MAG: cobalamin-binding protein [Candidatus Nitrosocaldus sp.]|nr:cobalamin-binding protein [Candidatus Nitrosocaldus sp.]MDW8275553.1 cobalamin-binding protein [Candidatus Nitrosocaldus sp.]